MPVGCDVSSSLLEYSEAKSPTLLSPTEEIHEETYTHQSYEPLRNDYGIFLKVPSIAHESLYETLPMLVTS